MPATDAALLHVQLLVQQGAWKDAEDAVGTALPAVEGAWGESAPTVSLALLLTAEVCLCALCQRLTL